MTCAPTLELVNSLTLPLTGGLGGEQPAEGNITRVNNITYTLIHIVFSIISGFHPEQKVGGGSFWKEELSTARGVWGMLPQKNFSLCHAGCGTWSLVVSDGVATSNFIDKLAARRGNLVVGGGGGGGELHPFPPYWMKP